MIVALVAGTVLAVLALSYVLYPIFFPPRTIERAEVALAGAGEGRDGGVAVVALREIEFDRATGKLSDADYTALRQRYVDEAVIELRRKAAPRPALAVADQPDDAVEAAVRAYRATHPSCPSCGPRPEVNATYCSECGRFLAGRCRDCNAAVTASGARYCAECGHGLSAALPSGPSW